MLANVERLRKQGASVKQYWCRFGHRDVSAMDWTIVQPLGLTDAPATGKPFVATDGSRKSTRVSRTDVATVCIDAVEQARYVRETIVICAAT